ncbi:hypothetical protein BKA70DRAFT_1270644 [Coprinopsis sp. MPI-PUGE-AT-0042]|nr:hypothetical protein BKA70DRAFT_1270644 [Coprinopsis sp. MPI-PUGE-AT-0042]
MIVWRCGVALSRLWLLLSTGFSSRQPSSSLFPQSMHLNHPSLSSPRHQHNGGTSTATVGRTNEDADTAGTTRPRSQHLLYPPPAVRAEVSVDTSRGGFRTRRAAEDGENQEQDTEKARGERRMGLRPNWGSTRRRCLRCCWITRRVLRVVQGVEGVAVVVDEKTEYWKQWEKWHQNRQAVPNYPISCG